MKKNLVQGIAYAAAMSVLGLCGFYACKPRSFNSAGTQSTSESPRRKPSVTAVTHNGFDVNDVSYLFAMTDSNSGAMNPEMNLLDDNLVSQAVLDKAILESKKVKIDGLPKNRKAWKIVGFRYDPCAPSLQFKDNNEECFTVIRLIAQPFNPKDQDMALHLTYELPGFPELNDPILAELAELKAVSPVDTNGKALGVHPGLNTMQMRPANGGVAIPLSPDDKAKALAFGTKVKAFLNKHLSVTNLFDIAIMGLENGGPEPWIFIDGEVKDDNWRPFGVVSYPCPNKTATDESMCQTSIKLSFIDSKRILPKVPEKFPESNEANVHATVLFSESGSKDFGGLKNKEEVVAFIEHPRKAHTSKTDCVSCHVTSARTISEKFVVTKEHGRFIPPAGTTGYVDPETRQDNRWNVRNFGYFRSHPTVIFRVANESADIANYLNKKVFGLTANPGKDCTAQEQDVWQCFVTTTGNADTCLAKCK